ncbi:hypothetical protein GGR02_003461 [Anoxybacillus voinovskiensis]|uniref:Plasmid pRiA4b Orf3-like domain-containing protein n=1 Tax=Anoxybacteroides voinovskiense TaxID=230470 RepID=A0A840E1G0_9BACL|nr:plasmid pRiA4b ORF-3 family protein [Anoxybacillus voinovskiensis]MBB4075609.1 hypothetical protein [Anoxybacillus voinovskiensis]GGJ80401.1 plasmid pRiA4b ORF-3 family protein [Anoxybacillus voinovskiensis]
MTAAWEALKKGTNLSDDETLPTSLRHEMEQVLKGEKQTETIYQLKIELCDIHPPIWRRVLVPSTISFHQLHLVIQQAMGWLNDHLYEFETKDAIVDIPHPDDAFIPFQKRKLDAQRTLAKEHLHKEKQKIIYTYDFGDDWKHTITLEKIEKTAEPLTHPICLKGKRACPPEDIGGSWGYQETLAMLQDDTRKEESEEFFDWYGGTFDPEYFDLEEANKRLSIVVFV